MTDQKEKNKNYKTEFSFSFNKLAETVGGALNSTFGSIGEEPETSYFEEAIGGAQNATVSIGGGVGKLHVHTGDDPALLAKVETLHIGKMHFSAESDGKGDSKTVKIENQVIKGGLKGFLGGFGKQRDLYMDVALADSLPLNLKISNSVGEALIDLRGLTISEFRLDTGVGPSTTYLPDGDYKVSIDGGLGPAFINLPATTGNKVKIDGGVGPVVVNLAENADLTIDADAGVGPFTINVPVGTPLMIEYESGLGPLSKPSGLVQKSKNIWHTEGYDLADRSVYIKLEGGVGPARIKFVTDPEEAVSDEKAKRDQADL